MNDRKIEEGFQIFEISAFKTTRAPLDLGGKKPTIVINQKKKQPTRKQKQKEFKEIDQQIQLDTQYIRNVNQGLMSFDEDFIEFRPLMQEEKKESGLQDALQSRIQAQFLQSIINQNPYKNQSQESQQILLQQPQSQTEKVMDMILLSDMKSDNEQLLTALHQTKNEMVLKKIFKGTNTKMLQEFDNSFFSTTDKNLLTQIFHPERILLDKLLSSNFQPQLVEANENKNMIKEIKTEFSLFNISQDISLRLISQNSKEGLRVCQNLRKPDVQLQQVQRLQQSKQLSNDNYSLKQYQKYQTNLNIPQNLGHKVTPSLMPVVHSPPSMNLYQSLSRERQTEEIGYYQSRYNSAGTNKSYITEQSRILKGNFHMQLFQILFTNKNQNVKFNLLTGSYDELVNIYICSELFEQNEIVIVNDFTSIYLVDQNDLNPDRLNNSKEFYSNFYRFLEKLDQRKTNYVVISLSYEKFGLREEGQKICTLNKSIKFYYFDTYEQVPGYIYQISRNHRENTPMLEISSSKINNFLSQFDLFDMKALLKRKQQKTLYQTLVKYLQ